LSIGIILAMPVISEAGSIDSLFSEVNTLATRLKHGRHIFEEEQDWAGGARSVLLLVARHGAQTVPAIARLRSTSRQNIQTVINRLKVAGLARLEANPAHKRSALVRLTPQGSALVKQLEKAETNFFKDVQAKFSAEELVSATECLRKLRRLLADNGEKSQGKKERLSKRGRATAARSGVVLPGPEKPPVAETEPTSENGLPVNLL
jgi:DNA-binding MarR family transcriptional regulator